MVKIRFKIAFYEDFLSGYWPRGLFLFQTYQSFLIIERLVFSTSSIPPLYLMFNFFLSKQCHFALIIQIHVPFNRRRLMRINKRVT